MTVLPAVDGLGKVAEVDAVAALAATEGGVTLPTAGLAAADALTDADAPPEQAATEPRARSVSATLSPRDAVKIGPSSRCRRRQASASPRTLQISDGLGLS